MTLPDEWRFDIRRAAAEVAALAATVPDARVTLTIAQWADGGLDAEADIYLGAREAAALLETVAEDQSLRSGSRTLFVLRVARADPLRDSP